MSLLVSPALSSSHSFGFRSASLSPLLALSLVLVCGALVPQVAHSQTYTLSTLVTFNGSANGQNPLGGLTLDSNGNVYGTTIMGGADETGTVFKIALDTNTLTTLATFTGTGGIGEYPEGGVILDSSGNLYGTTAGDLGGVFKVAAGTNTLTELASFNGYYSGTTPESGLILDSSGNLYGTTFEGGTNNYGTVFEVAAGTNTLTTLVTFNGTANGANPKAGLTLDSSGNLYGTTSTGGANNDGTVFKIAAGTNTLTTLATFSGASNGGPTEGPEGPLVFDSSGNIYGTTFLGGAGNYGTVFKISAGTGTLTTLATFTGSNGAEPVGTLSLDSSGNIYGETSQGGTSGDGTVFKIAAGTNTLTTLATFTGAGNGKYGYSGIILDSNGNLYGTTSAGGANGDGTAFELMLTAAASTPEPSALLLLAPGALGLIAIRRRRKAA